MPEVIEFEGEHASLMGGYVSFRRGPGFVEPPSPRRILRHTAELLHTMPPVPEVIGRDRAEAVAERRGGGSGRTRQSRFVVPRQLRPRLNRIGIPAYVPPAGQVKAGAGFVPRIVGERETARITEVAEGKAPRWPPMVLKILRCTGIRVGEAAAPTVGDFHREGRQLHVAHAKNDRSRIIPVSRTLAEDLGEHVDAHVPGGDPSRWLFPGREPGTHRNKVAVSNRLRSIYREAGVLADGGEATRTHDLRHSFAVKALENMVGRGCDVYAAPPLLSAFMGHANIYDTEHCLRFLPSAHRAPAGQESPVSDAAFGGGAP